MAVFLFPGQGSQAPKMGEFLYQNFEIARKIFDEASDSIGIDMKKLCFEGSEQELAQTENTQPAILCVSVATYQVIRKEFNVSAEMTAGHSVGEYASLVSNGTLNFKDAIKAVRLRGQAMQSAVPLGEGGMMAVLGLDLNQVHWLCKWVENETKHSPLSPANDNCPGQIVISGSSKCLHWLKENFKPEIIPGTAKKAKLIPLNVSAPFHCLLMKPAQEKMKVFLSDVVFSKPQFPVIQNYTALEETNPEKIKENLIQQISAPVLWTQTMQLLKSKNLNYGIECGHGQVLKGLFKKMDSEFFKIATTQNIEELNQLKTN